MIQSMFEGSVQCEIELCEQEQLFENDLFAFVEARKRKQEREFLCVPQDKKGNTSYRMYYSLQYVLN